jgi:hypothetical protein
MNKKHSRINSDEKSTYVAMFGYDNKIIKRNFSFLDNYYSYSNYLRTSWIEGIPIHSYNWSILINTDTGKIVEHSYRREEKR